MTKDEDVIYMLILWSSLAGLLLYLEIAYHFAGFGWSEFNLVYTVALVTVWTGAETMLIGMLRGWLKKAAYQLALWLPVVWTSAQLVYLRIFKQPLLMEAMFRGGGDALSNYWREALDGILGALPFIVAFALPVILMLVVFRKFRWRLPNFALLDMMRTLVIIALGTAASFVVMGVGKGMDAEYYEDYTEFYDPLTVARTMGVLPTFQRDTLGRAMSWLGDLGHGRPSGTELAGGDPGEARTEQESGSLEHNLSGRPAELGENKPLENIGESGSDPIGDEQAPPEVTPEPEEEKPHLQQFPLDFEKLRSLADNDKQAWLAEYIQGLAPVYSNEYTGKFEGYNLIFLTAEGFSTYAVNEELTPTLYRLTHTGFIFDNYYVPLWQTSTSDGEYVNCTALIPDGQFSMRKSAQNDMAYTLPMFFAKEKVASWGYHNGKLDYYERHESHPNLGYDFKACKLGGLSEEEWGDKIFPMDNPNSWPASDLDMMIHTIPEYVGADRFHVYYMTVSGHMNYNFGGNAMSFKNKDAVAGLEMSENGQAYIACHIELDKALEYLLAQLEEAGKLENTVICLSADHYPYGMTEAEYEELAGKSLSQGMDTFRNSLVLWNSSMAQEEPVHVEKVCGAMDLLPTLLNLFGFDYDARMYAGRDIFSDQEGMVIFNDRSYVTDMAEYKRGSDVIWKKDQDGNDLVPDEQKEDYLQEKKQEVKNRYQFSAYVLQENYYQDIEQAVILPAEE